MNRKPTQTEMILRYIDEYGSITSLDAMRELGVMRLASRISELRKSGYPIESKVEKVKNRYGETCWVKRYQMEENN